MNTLIKSTIGVIVLTLGSSSIALAEKHDKMRDGDGSRHAQSSRDYRSHDDSKNFRNHKSEKRYSSRRDNHNRHASKHHKRKHAYRNVRHGNKHHGHRKVVKHVVQYDNYRPYSRHNRHLSALMGGLIGSAIGHDLGRGDPAATATGAVFGTIMGRALYH